jgi:hypothetical protein
MTALFEKKTPEAFKRAIADQFRQRPVGNAADLLSWGQFLDNLSNQAQVGLYGTVSACVAFKLAHGPNDPNSRTTHDKLVGFWNTRASSDDAQNNFAQNVRIAMLLLGLASEHAFADAAVQDVWTVLKSKLHSTEHMWGDSRSPADLAFVSSEYTTSIILLLLFAIRALSTGTDAVFADLDAVRVGAAKALQRSYLSDLTRQRPYSLVLLLAVVTNLNKDADRRIRKPLNRHAVDAIDIKQRYTYFFDYQKSDGTYKRDFLIAPVEVLCALLLYSAKISGMQFLLSTRVLVEVEKALKDSHYGLFEAGVERPSTMEQAFVVLALHAYSVHTHEKAARIWPWIQWRVQKDIEHERLAALFILLGAYAPIGLVASADSVMKWIGGIALPHGVMYLLYAFRSVPQWLATGLAVFAAVAGKPQELLRVLLVRGKK